MREQEVFAIVCVILSMVYFLSNRNSMMRPISKEIKQIKKCISILLSYQGYGE